MDMILVAKLARQALTALGAFLIAKGVLSADQSAHLQNAILELSGAMPVIYSVGMVIYRHYRPAGKSAAVISLVDVSKTAGAVILALVLGSCLFGAPRAEAAGLSLTSLNSAISTLNSKIAALQGKVNSTTGLTGSPTTDLNALFTKIQTVSLADFEAADADATATKDTIAEPCYAAIVTLIKAQQSVASPVQNTAQPGVNVPTTHIVLTFQRFRDFVNALRPGAPVSAGCSQLAAQSKMDLTTLVAAIVGGTLTAASFGL